MIAETYRAVRRKTASLLNGYIMPRLGFKVVRSRPNNFRYTKLASHFGITTLSVTRVGGGEFKVRLRESTSDWMTFDQIFLDEDYDLRPLSRYGELAALYKRLCREGSPLIVDLGGNIGLSPLYFSAMWPEAQVVTVEPDEQNFTLLAENVGQRKQIDTILAGAASRATRLKIIDPKAGKNAFRTETSSVGLIPGITVTEILTNYCAKGCIPFAVKIDIEGVEAELFSDSTDWINEFPLIIIELHDWLFPGKRTSTNFLRAVSGLDRDFIYLDENIFSIKNSLMLS